MYLGSRPLASVLMKLPRRAKRNVSARKFQRSAAPVKEFSIDLALAAPEKARSAAWPLMTVALAPEGTRSAAARPLMTELPERKPASPAFFAAHLSAIVLAGALTSAAASAYLSLPRPELAPASDSRRSRYRARPDASR